MARADFNVTCLSSYKGSLDIPDDIKDDKLQVLDYIRNNLPSVEVQDLEWLSDLDPDEAVTMDDIRDIYDEPSPLPSVVIS